MSSTIHLCVSISESWSHWWPKLRDWAVRPVGAGWYSWAALSLINSKTLYMSQAYSVPTNLKYYTVHKKPSCSKTYQTYHGSVTTPSKSFLFPNVNWRITFKSSLLIYLPSPLLPLSVGHVTICERRNFRFHLFSARTPSDGGTKKHTAQHSSMLPSLFLTQ